MPFDLVKVPKKLHSRSKKPVETSTNPNYQNTRIPIITYTMTITYDISIHISSYEQGLSNDMTKTKIESQMTKLAFRHLVKNIFVIA
jgi:hypothetical protein